MAKKSTAPSKAPRRRQTKAEPAAAPVDIATVARTEPIESSDNHSRHSETEDKPTADEIAQAAYQRYLSRGGQHGADFDDWLEAERELRSRHKS